MAKKGFAWEEQVSGLAYLNGDKTAASVLAATSLQTAGHANSTATFVVNLGRYAENTLYIQSANGPVTNAGTTGLTVFMGSRPASAVGFSLFKTETGVQTTGACLYEWCFPF